MKRTDMRKLRLYYDGTVHRPGAVYRIVGTVHQRDADRVLAEPWPFTWTPPGQHPDTLPFWWPEDQGGVEEWRAYHWETVVGA